MIRILLLLTVFATLTVGRRSPNADLVDKFLKTPAGSRYSSNVEEDAKLDVPGLVAKYGYPIEVHKVATPDGYILEAHRIPHGRDENNQPDPNKPVVFVMHGLLSSSADFLTLGPTNALGYLLAEAGYDVWLGNARGNFYSRIHLTLNPDIRQDLDFWRFSWDEIGNNDLSTLVDYILLITGQSKLHYIGHSQGGTAFFVLNSLRPEYNDKFISFQGLAPAAFFINNESPLFNSLAQFERIIETLAYSMGIGELFGKAESPNGLSNFCEDSILQNLCASLTLNGDSLGHYINDTMLPLFMGHSPAGASVRQVAHFGQSIRDGTFRRFNHGVLLNLAVYGRLNPPDYDLSKVTVPAYLHYGLNDSEVDYRDLYVLAERLGNTVGTYQVERPTFTHFDFIWGADARSQLYDKVIELLKVAERNN